MEKKIYLPDYAKEQLETSGDASVWTEPIPYRDKPEDGFTLETTLGDSTLELGADSVLENGFYHPDRDQDLESTLEYMEQVKIKGKKTKKKKPAKKKVKTDEKKEFRKLTIEDFANPMFDKQRPVKRKMPARESVYHLIEDGTNFDDLVERIYEETGDYELAEEKAFSMQCEEKKEPVIEGLTFTNEFNVVGYTYFPLDGMLFVNWLDEKKKENVRLVEKVIGSYEDFDKCLKKADKEIRKYLG